MNADNNIDPESLEIEGVFYNDPPIPDDSLKTIQAISRDDACMLWDTYVDAQRRHFMLLPNSSWPAKITSSSAPIHYWHGDWNSNTIEPHCAKLMTYEISPKEPTLIFWMRGVARGTVWDTFCKHWINFLYEDEGCIVLFPENKHAFIFSNGRTWQGFREES